MNRFITSIISSIFIIGSAFAQPTSLLNKFSQIQYHANCGGWYFLSRQSGGQTLYGLADKSGNVIVSDALKYKLHKGYIEFYLIDPQKKANHDQWVNDMKQYEIQMANYNRIQAEYDAAIEAYNIKLDAAKTEATARWNARRAQVEREAKARVEAQQRQQAQQNVGGTLGIIGAVLGGINGGLEVVNAVNAVKYEPFLEQVKSERGILVKPAEPYNPYPSKPKEPDSGFYWASYSLRQPCNYTYVDYEKISEGDGYADVRTPDGMWGLVDATMYEVIRCNNKNKVFVGWQNENACKIQTNNGYGIINKNNKIIIPTQYGSLNKLGNKGYIAKKNNTVGVLGLKGDVKMPFIYQEIKEVSGLIYCKKENKWGIFTQQFEELFPCQFQNIELTKLNGNTYLLNQLKGQWGVIDFNTGKSIIPNQFNTIQTLTIGENKDCFKVTKGSHIGIYAENGSVILPTNFDNVEIKDGMLRVKKDQYSGLYTIAGSEIIPALQYNDFSAQTISADKKSLRVYNTIKDGKHGVCNQFGVELIPCEYAELVWLDNIGAYSAKKDGKYGLLSIAGDEIIPFVIPSAPSKYSSRSHNYIIYGIDYGAVDYNGTIISHFKKYNSKNEQRIAKNYEKQDKKVNFALTKIAKEKKELMDIAFQKVINSNDSELKRRNTFSFYAQNYVERIINDWQQRGEFEKVSDWKLRVNDKSRSQKIYELTVDAQKAYINLMVPTLPSDNPSIVGSYDPDNETYRIKTSYSDKGILVHVPSIDAQEFKANFNSLKKQPEFFIENDNIGLSQYHFYMSNGKKYSYNNLASLTYNLADVEYNFNPIEIDESASNKNFKGGKQTINTRSIRFGTSDIDVGIPQTTVVNEKTFAVIIANENYQQEDAVEFAYNDGQIFRQYCIKTLGLPEKNVHFRADATLNDMRFEFNWLKQIASAYEGDAKFIIYYAGHGMPDAKTKNAYLLPIDGYSSDINSGYRLSDFYDELSDLQSENVIAFMDACFSGVQRDGHALTKGERGVAITPDINAPKGNLLIFSATSGNETAHAYTEKQHGLFTYFLLKKLKEHEGPLFFGDLVNYVKKEVRTNALRNTSVSQTPTVKVASKLASKWQKIQIK